MYSSFSYCSTFITSAKLSVKATVENDIYSTEPTNGGRTDVNGIFTISFRPEIFNFQLNVQITTFETRKKLLFKTKNVSVHSNQRRIALSFELFQILSVSSVYGDRHYCLC